MLINRYYVVTAAHCHRANSRMPINKVRLGDWKVVSELASDTGSELQQDFHIQPEDIVVHEDYKKTFDNVVNDIALIKLPKRAELNLGTQMICLPHTAAEFRDYLTTEDFEGATAW